MHTFFLIFVVIALVAVGAVLLLGWVAVMAGRALISRRLDGRWVWLPTLLLCIAGGAVVVQQYPGVVEEFPLLTLAVVIVVAVVVRGLWRPAATHRRVWESVAALADPSAPVRDEAAARLRSSGAAAASELARAAGNRTFAGRTYAAHLFGEVADPLSAGDRLFLFHRRADDTESPEMREAAAAALATLMGRAAGTDPGTSFAFRAGRGWAKLRTRVMPRRTPGRSAPRVSAAPNAGIQRGSPPVTEGPAMATVRVPPLARRAVPPPPPPLSTGLPRPVGTPAIPAAAGTHRVFVSHSSLDGAVGHLICATLERHQLPCWIAPRDIPPGVAWGEAIIDGINGSRVMVVVISRNSNDSPQVLREVERAVSKKLAVIAFRIDDVPLAGGLEYFLSAAQWLDAVVPPLELHLDPLTAAAVALTTKAAAGGVAH